MKVALLIAAVALGLCPAAAQDPIREKLDAIYGRGGYQRELPKEGDSEVGKKKDTGGTYRPRETPEATEMPEWLRKLLEAIARFVAAIIPVLPWIALGLIVIWALLLLRHVRMPQRAERGAPRAPPVAAAPAAAGAGAAIPDPALLAREGRFDEAIHAQLLMAIERLRTATGDVLEPSLTSREVAAAVPLGGSPKDALGRMVRAVEVTLFGGRPASEAEYVACAADLALIGGER